MGNGNWNAKIYLNEEIQTIIKVKNQTSLKDIRKLCEEILPEDEDYYFISRKNAIIRNDINFSAIDVWKDDEDGDYKIDLMTLEYFNSIQSGLITLYLNNFQNSAILYKKNMSLSQIKYLGGSEINKDSVYFLTKDNVIIENINNLVAKDVIKIEKNGQKIINLVTKEYYKRVQVIEHLKKLENSTEKIDWLKQTEFFRKIRDFAGEEIAQAIISELLEKIGTEEKINDREYIKKFLNLLIEKDDNNINETRPSSSGF